MEPLDFLVYLNPAYGQYELHAALRRHDGRWIARGPLGYEQVEPGQYTEPLMRMNPEDAQKLIDALWNAGLRPNNGDGGLAHVDAMRGHLADMRAIVTKVLGVEL